MKLLLYCLLAMLWPVGQTHAQKQATKIRPLTVGDTLPLDLILKNVINYSSSKIELAKLDDQPLVIDFWETFCSSCIKGLEKLQSIRKKNPNFQVITVTKNSTSPVVERIFKRIGNNQSISFPVVLNDSVLSSIFPHEIISHLIWIDKNRVIKAITGSDYISDKNVQSFIEGEVLNWPVKQDLIGFDYNNPILTVNNQYTTSRLYSSISPFISGVDNKYQISNNEDKGIIVHNYFNFSILSLLRISLEGKNSGAINPKLFYSELSEQAKEAERKKGWLTSTRLCYSAVLPLEKSKIDQSTFVKIDLKEKLKFLYGLELVNAKKKIPCIVIENNGNALQKLRSKSSKQENSLYKNTPVKTLTASPLNLLVWHLNNNLEQLPWIIDETNIPEEFLVDIEVPDNAFTDIVSLNNAFEKYDLKFSYSQRVVDVYLLKRVNNFHHAK